MLLQVLAEQLDRKPGLPVLETFDEIVLERDFLGVGILERRLGELPLGFLKGELLLGLVELVLHLGDGLYPGEFLGGSRILELCLQTLDLRVLLGGSLLGLLGRLRDRQSLSGVRPLQLGLETLDLSVFVAESLLGLLGGLRHGESLRVGGPFDLVLESLNLGFLLRGGFLGLLSDLRLGEFDLCFLGLFGFSESRV